ncbi:hypothetical protein [Bacillus sp. FJAT-27225]|uniref:hypothetical protein n=1 Tax=Bacillus sp. FJAT-27225 TaxID=1743144 RepID=UPI001586F4B2|nr:hypothetical protein [Bacillus sp. FJAT-27225]
MIAKGELFNKTSPLALGRDTGIAILFRKKEVKDWKRRRAGNAEVPLLPRELIT